MEKIVVMSCTNRANSNTLKVSRIYEKIISSKKIPVSVLDFSILPHNIAFGETFGNRSEGFRQLIHDFVSTSPKFIFVIPEYNGSFPGILKLFLESVPPHEWADKDACLVGVAEGRAGNLRGMDHLTGILGYLKMHVYHNKLPISNIAQLLDSKGDLVNRQQLKVCTEQVDGFLAF